MPATAIEIRSEADLRNIGSHPDFPLDAEYTLLENISISETTWIAIGNFSRPFSGSFDGNNKTITFENDVRFQKSDSNGASGYGLFGNINNATIQNLQLAVHNITADGSNRNRVGSVVGHSFIHPTELSTKSNRLLNCSVVPANAGQGATISGNYYVGGLVGLSYLNMNASSDPSSPLNYADNLTLSNCSVSINVAADTDYAGGLIGNMLAGGIINGSSAKGNVSAVRNYVGGLVGYFNDSGEITSSFAAGTVSGNNFVGGLIGLFNNSTVSDSYAVGDVQGNSSVGGLVGSTVNGAVVQNNYAEGNINAQRESGGLVGRLQNSRLEGSNASGTITAGTQSGGLVGSANNSEVLQSRAAGNVSVTSYGGGLIGLAVGNTTVTDCSASGSVLSEENIAGGLIGYANQTGMISGSSAAGNVTSRGNYAGGLIGRLNNSNISNCYATGEVSANTDYAGGLSGVIDTGSRVENSYATGNVTAGSNYAGGLAALINTSSRVSSSYATGNVNASNYAGGFVSYFNSSEALNCYSVGNVSSAGNYSGGFAGRIIAGEMQNCYTVGTVSGRSYIGGFAGMNNGTIRNSTALNERVDSETAAKRFAGGGGGTLINSAAWQNMKTNQSGFEDETNVTLIRSFEVWENFGTLEPFGIRRESPPDFWTQLKMFFNFLIQIRSERSMESQRALPDVERALIELPRSYWTTAGWNNGQWKMNEGNENYELPVLTFQTEPVTADASYLNWTIEIGTPTAQITPIRTGVVDAEFRFEIDWRNEVPDDWTVSVLYGVNPDKAAAERLEAVYENGSWTAETNLTVSGSQTIYYVWAEAADNEFETVVLNSSRLNLTLASNGSGGSGGGGGGTGNGTIIPPSNNTTPPGNGTNPGEPDPEPPIQPPAEEIPRKDWLTVAGILFAFALLVAALVYYLYRRGR